FVEVRAGPLSRELDRPAPLGSAGQDDRAAGADVVLTGLEPEQAGDREPPFGPRQRRHATGIPSIDLRAMGGGVDGLAHAPAPTGGATSQSCRSVSASETTAGSTVAGRRSKRAENAWMTARSAWSHVTSGASSSRLPTVSGSHVSPSAEYTGTS